MPSTTLQLLPPLLEANISRIGRNIAGPGHFGHTTGLCTVAMKLANYRGKIFIEGTLALNPTDEDWFALISSLDGPFLLFPSYDHPSTNPIGSPGFTGTIGKTFQINCLWMRARSDRSYLIPTNATEAQIAPYGFVDSISVNF